MSFDEDDLIVIDILMKISEMGNHPVSDDELWEEVSISGHSLKRADVSATVDKLFAANKLIYAFDRKLRLVNYTQDEFNRLNQSEDGFQKFLLGKHVLVNKSLFDDINPPVIVIGDMRREDYSVPKRIPLTITEDQSGFKITATNPEDVADLDEIIQDMLDDDDDGDSVNNNNDEN